MFLIHNAKKTPNTTSVYALKRVSPERLVAGFHLKLDQLVEEIFFRLAWDKRSNQDIRECTTMEEHREYEVLFYHMAITIITN